MDSIRPPQRFTQFFEWYCKERLQESILGDLEEQFYDEAETKGIQMARLRYVWNIIRFMRPGIVKNINESQQLNYIGMFKNYYKVSVRNILRNKTFSILNVTGLAIGLASCLLILIYVNNELSYDTYNQQYAHTYRVLHYYGEKDEDISGKTLPVAEHQVWGNAPVADALKEYYPQIEHLARFTSTFNWLIEYEDRKFQEKNVVFADAAITQIFDWTWHGGNPKTALERPETIVLSKQMAQKYFGKDNPVGKVLTMDGDGQFEVTGVFEIPPNSHFAHDAYVSMATFKDMRPEIFDYWGYVDFYSYLTINPQNTIASLTAKVPAFLDKYFESDYAYSISFEPLANAYLYSDAGRQPGPVGSRTNIYTFISVAIFILVIACINFTNLATGRSVERAKEVAIRKTVGSHKSAIITQFLLEAILLTFIAALLATGLVIIGHKYLEQLVGKAMPAGWLLQPQYLLGAALFVVVIGMLAGSYPAFVLSKFKPVTVLKGSFKNSTQGVWLRKALVVLQFSLSIILLVGTVLVYQQLTFLKNHDKGFDAEQLLVIDYGGDGKVKQNLKVVKAALAAHPAVQRISASRATPGDFLPNAGTTIEGPDGSSVGKSPAIYEIDEDFIPTYDIEVLAGRNFSKDHPRDTNTALLVNEAAARLFGYANPEEIVGKKFDQWGRVGKVVGVVDDFNYQSLHKRVEPLVLRYSIWWSTERFSIKLKSANMGNTLNELKAIWTEVAPTYPFNAHFNNDSFNQQYEADARFGHVFTVFAGLAMFVACLGLFGLTIYSTNQRAKEIGIRKVLGAPVQSIVALLSADFVKLFAISLIIAVPVAWYIMNNWLSGFAYQVNISWQVFALAAVLTLVVSLLTMSFKTISAALTNPAEVLKNE